MKKILASILILTMTLSFCACAEKSEPDPLANAEDFVANEFSIEDILTEYTKQHVEALTSFDISNPKSVKDFELHTNGEVELSSSEIAELHNLSHERKQTISAEEALYDIDLLFRSLKFGYGPYYYFGGDDAFKTAEQSITRQINLMSQVDVDTLSDMLYDALLFVVDGHFSIDHRFSSLDDKNRYGYYYPENLEEQKFYQDENGYYKCVNNKKSYFISCDNANVSFEKSLFSDGEIAFGLIQFCPIADAHQQDCISFDHGDEIINWVKSTDYCSTRTEDDICLSLRSGDFQYIEDRAAAEAVNGRPASANLQAYQESGLKAQSAKTILYDIRRNYGGTMWAYGNWFVNYIGEMPELNRFCADYRNPLTASGYRSAEGMQYNETYSQARIYDNETPIIVLTDNGVGSNGESLFNRLKALTNVLTIGCNTDGAQMNQIHELQLPNSGIYYCAGSTLQCINTEESKEGKGYSPDIWCDPKYSLEYSLKMIERYNLASAEEVASITQAIQDAKVGFFHETIYFQLEEGLKLTEGLGAYDGDRFYNIVYGEDLRTDYSFTNSDDSIITVEKLPDGRLHVTQVGNGDSIITITIDGYSQDFNFHGGI